MKRAKEYLIAEHELRQMRWTLGNALNVLRQLEQIHTEKIARVPLRVAIEAIAEVETRLGDLEAADDT